MVSYVGHIVSGLGISSLAVWWLVNMFRDFRRCHRTGETYRSRISYSSTIRNKRIPVESFLKVFFFTLILIGEVSTINFNEFFVRDGHFVKVYILQHNNIHIMFLIHGITDLLDHFRVSPLTKQMKYVTGILTFVWWCIQMEYIVSEPTYKSPLEKMFLRMPLPSFFITGLMFLWEMRQRDTMTPQLIKCLTVLIAGTWYINIGVVLFGPISKHADTAWDHHDIQNVHFVTALYGYHVIFNVLVIIAVYILVASSDNVTRLVRGIAGMKDSKRPQQFLNGVGVGTAQDYKLLEDNDTDREY